MPATCEVATPSALVTSGTHRPEPSNSPSTGRVPSPAISPGESPVRTATYRVPLSRSVALCASSPRRIASRETNLYRYSNRSSSPM
jgi:hypothetical protein